MAKKSLQEAYDDLVKVNAQLQAEIAAKEHVVVALRNNETRYQLLIEYAPLGILSIDPQGMIVDVNAKLLELLGSPSAEATRKINVLTFPPLVQSGIVDDIVQCIDSGAPLYSERPYTSKWGKSAYFRSSVAPILDEQGRVLLVQLIIEDITERKHMEQEKNHLLDELLKSVEQIKTLSGLIPICANCKKIRDDEGFWHQVESYVQKHSDVEFSHSICPGCLKKLYPDFYPDST